MICLFQLVEEPAASAQFANKTEIEIRLVLADCACGRSKLARNTDENEPLLSEPQKQLAGREETMEDSKLEDNTIIVDASGESTEMQELQQKEPPTVIETSEGSKYDEFELNVCHFWGTNWRQFTSVLPGLLLLFTFGFNAVFTIYEINRLNSLSEDISATPKYNAADRGNGYSERSFDDGFGGYRSSGSSRNDYELNEDKPKLSLLSTCIVIMMWFVGAIVGNMLGASFVHKFKKRTIYVSSRRHFSVLGIFLI